MKIPRSVRDAYEDQLEKYKQLQKAVDSLIGSLKDPRWHYESRLKSEQGFALKLETGRASPNRLEDFFACMLVVENQARIRAAKDLVQTHFNLKYRRPQADDFTSKSSKEFPFDDLRLYVEYKDDPSQKPTGLNGLLFEFQIKTFLQHAWGIATHDLIYKSDTISWAKERIAFQIKAMLEHAEVSIETAENLTATPDLAKSDSLTKSVSDSIQMLTDLWKTHQLPTDVVRLAKNVSSLSKALGIEIAEIRRIIDKETLVERGVKTLNLSPYGIIVQSVINQEPEKVKAFLAKDIKGFKLFLPKEVEITAALEPLEKKNLVMM
jgi:ppGpp synthetase/RelA/SpoT-type nucleotidyltranferase